MSRAPAQQSVAPMSLGAVFAAGCGLRHDRDFLVDGELRLDGATADTLSRRLAARLHQHGLRTGQNIAFMCRPSVAHALTWFAAVRLGAVPSSLHLLDAPERLAETIAWLGADHVVHDEEFK